LLLKNVVPQLFCIKAKMVITLIFIKFLQSWENDSPIFSFMKILVNFLFSDKWNKKLTLIWHSRSFSTMRLRIINGIYSPRMVLIPNEMACVQTYKTCYVSTSFTTKTFGFAKRDFIYFLNCWIHPKKIVIPSKWVTTIIKVTCVIPYGDWI